MFPESARVGFNQWRKSMKRKMIHIDETLCNGCGACVTGCAEGALAMVNGKAKLVNDIFCDGLGACIGECPTGALKIIEREALEFDEAAVQKHVQEKTPPAAGCPGLQVRFGQQKPAAKPVASAVPGQVIPSELNQWPTQLHLVPVEAPFFKNRELVVLSTCSPSASPDVNWRFIRGRAIAIACPKLDCTEGYIEKLTEILKLNGIPKVIIVRMEVPCCGGLTMIVKEAARRSGRNDLIVEEAVIGLDGELREIKTLEV